MGSGAGADDAARARVEVGAIEAERRVEGGAPRVRAHRRAHRAVGGEQLADVVAGSEVGPAAPPLFRGLSAAVTVTVAVPSHGSGSGTAGAASELGSDWRSRLPPRCRAGGPTSARRRGVAVDRPVERDAPWSVASANVSRSVSPGEFVSTRCGSKR